VRHDRKVASLKRRTPLCSGPLGTHHAVGRTIPEVTLLEGNPEWIQDQGLSLVTRSIKIEDEKTCHESAPRQAFVSAKLMVCL